MLLLPLAFLVLGLSFLRDGAHRSLGERAVPPDAQQREPVAGWGAELEGPDGVRWRVSLAPLHADAARQAFEARALARRFALAAGEPWRLRAEPLAGEGARRSTPRLPLGEIEVRDDDGVALRPLVAADEPAPGALRDPLAVLLAPPRAASDDGGGATWFLWGRAPRGAVRMTGRTARAADEELVLAPVRVPREHVDVALVRRERDSGR